MHRLVARRLVEQALAERPPLVVVAHDPDELRARRVDERLDRRTHSTVGVGLAEVGHVAGHDDGVEGVAEAGELRHHLAQRPDRVRDPSEGRSPAQQMGVADVRDHPVRCRVPAELFDLHDDLPAASLLGASDRGARSSGTSAQPSPGPSLDERHRPRGGRGRTSPRSPRVRRVRRHRAAPAACACSWHRARGSPRDHSPPPAHGVPPLAADAVAAVRLARPRRGPSRRVEVRATDGSARPCGREFRHLVGVDDAHRVELAEQAVASGRRRTRHRARAPHRAGGPARPRVLRC